MKINDIIKQRYPFEPTKKIADDLCLTESQVYNRAFTMGIKKDPVYLRSTQFPAGYLGGKATQFQRGHVPANKGYKMSKEVYEKAKPTMFKKGNLPFNTQPVGTINKRLDTNGKFYSYIKIAHSNWQLLNRYLWEQNFGKIPPGMIVIFKDNNEDNFEISNLELISKKENMQRNSMHQYPLEIKQIIILKNKLIKKTTKWQETN